jgi:integrase/recombinase XerD
MAHIGAQRDIGFASPSESIQAGEKRPSFFVSPRPCDPGDSLKEALGRAFGPRSSLFARLMGMEAPDTAYVQRYLLQMHRRNFKPLTIQQVFITLRGFLAFLNSTGQRRVGEVTRGDLETFVEYEQDRGHKLSTARTSLARIYAFLSFLVEEELIPPDVLVRKVKLRVPERLPRAMDPDELRRLLSVIADTRDRAMVLILLRTGMRIGELLTTPLRDVNIKERTITIFEGRKNRRGRVVYLSDDALCALKAWLKKRDPQKEFLFYARGRHTMCYTTARMMFEKYCNQAGLGHKRYSLHCLRHTFASELLNAGMRLECLQQLLGHDSIEVTRRYARLTDKTREREYFQAMAIIERGEIHGTYRLHYELQAIPKETQQLAAYGHQLHGEPHSVSRVAGGAD